MNTIQEIHKERIQHEHKLMSILKPSSMRPFSGLHWRRSYTTMLLTTQIKYLFSKLFFQKNKNTNPYLKMSIGMEYVYAFMKPFSGLIRDDVTIKHFF